MDNSLLLHLTNRFLEVKQSEGWRLESMICLGHTLVTDANLRNLLFPKLLCDIRSVIEEEPGVLKLPPLKVNVSQANLAV